VKSKFIRSFPQFLTLVASASAQSLTNGLIAYYDFEETGAPGIANKAPGAIDHNGAYLGDISTITGAGAGFSGNTAYPGAVTTNSTDRSLLLAGNALNVAKANTASSAGRGAFQVSTLTSRGTGLAGGGSMGPEFTVSSWFFAARDADNTSTTGDIIRSFVFESVLDGPTSGVVFDISWGTSGNNTTYSPYLGGVIGISPTLADNQWHHVLHSVTSDGTTSTLRSYVNGTLSATITAPTSSVDFRGINFGAHRSGGRIFDGLIDEVAVWDRALSAAEAAEVHELGADNLPLVELFGTFLYWDADGVTAGAGGASPTGDWSGQNWTTDPLGLTAGSTWTADSTAVFAAGQEATGAYTVTLDGTQQAANILTSEGAVSLSGGTLALSGSSNLRALGSSSLTISSALTASQLSVIGNVTLQSGTTIASPVGTRLGTLTLQDDFTFGGLSGSGAVDFTTGSLTLAPAANVTSSFSGTLVGTANLVKSGAGIQILNRSNDGFTGGITLDAGTLVLAGAKSHTGANIINGGMLVADNTLLGTLDVALGAGLSIGSTVTGTSRTTLRLEGTANIINGNLTVDLDSVNTTSGAGTNDLLQISGDVTFGAGSTITPRFTNGLPGPLSVYELAWVRTGTRTGLPSVDPAFQALSRYIFQIQPGSVFANDVQLAIIGGTPEFLVWAGDGINNVWETGGVQNWQVGGSPSVFLMPDNVDFDDSGNNALPVQVTGEILPSSIRVLAETKDYVWAGDGVVKGATGLDKSGLATLTLLNRNEFSGSVSISAGGITVGNGGTIGTLGGSGDIQVSAGAVLTFDRSDSVNPGRRVTGGGSLVQSGTGALRLGQVGNNANITIDSGTFEALDGSFTTSYFSTADRQIVINGGTLVTSTHTLGGLGGTFNRPDITINTGGTWQLNAEQYMNAGDLIMNGGTLLVTAVDLRLEGGTMAIGASSGGSQITRSGSGSVTLFASPTFEVADGAAAVDLDISAPVNQNGTQGLTKTGVGVMRLSAANTFAGTTTISAGTLQLGGTSGSLGSGPLVNNSVFEINRSDATTLANVISGTGAVAVKGSGTVTLTGANTYTGNTTVEAGTLELGTSGRLAFALIGTSSNSVSGPGTASFNGAFQLDLTAADLTDGTSWALAAVTSQTFGPSFAILSSAGSFTKSGVLHTLLSNGRTWTFSEATGMLTVNDGLNLGNGTSLKMLNGTEAGSGPLTVSGGNLWLGQAVAVTNDIVLVGPAAQNTFGGTLPIDYLVVGGGGGGAGRDSSGGGGGGGVVSNLFTPGLNAVLTAPGEALSVSVGDGGAGGGVSSSGGTAGQGTNGQNSSFGSVTALGGGGGGSYNTAGKSGASGGGGGRQPLNGGGAGTTDQGTNGGGGSGNTNIGATTADAGGGGGGAGVAGSNGVAGSAGGGGKGGDGRTVAFLTPSLATSLNIGQVSGGSVYFGGGGGGTPHRNGTSVPSGLGGLGGGGGGSTNNSSTFATPGTANTGGGGGASRTDNATRGIGGKGGSGVVLARYPGNVAATGGADIRTEDGYTYHTFTGLGAGTLTFSTFTGTASATISGTISGSGGFTWNSAGTLTLTAANSYNGDTVVSGGTLALQQATLADGAAVYLNNGATLNLPHGQTDTVAALWINGVQQTAGTYNSSNSGGAITGTGSILVGGGPSGFAAWISGFYPGETNPTIVGPNADANGDGVANALVYLFGGDPKNGNNAALLPTATLVTNPGGTVPDGDYLVLTYRHDTTAVVNATVERSATLQAPWTATTNGVDGAVIVETPDGFAPGIKKVEVFIPRSSARLFGRVRADIP
jgi:autotransporter-associated beta strand protein